MVKWYRLLATLSLAAVLIVPLLFNSLAAAQEKIEDNYVTSPLSAPGDPVVDNSTSTAFPPIGGQGNLSSCVSWAATYYQMTYENALARGINVSGGDNSNIFSPRWTYDFCNGGSNGDSDPNSTYEVMAKNGAATLAQFPYIGDDSNPASYRAWSLNPAVWRSAINYRPSWSSITGSGDSFINSLKTQVAGGRVLTFCTYVQSWDYHEIGDDPNTEADNSLSGQFIATYMSTSQKDYHTMTIVGYNDYIWCDINRNGAVDSGEKGAFKIANSRGTGDWNRGFRWVSYDALRSRSTVSGTDTWPPADRDSRGIFLGKAWRLTANPDYTPTMLARVTLNHEMRDQLDILLGVGSAGENEPSVIWESAAINTPAGGFAFDGSTTAVDGTFYFDFTDIASQAPANARWFVGVEDGYEDGHPSTIKSFILYRVTGGRDVEVGRNESVQTVDHGRIWVGIDANAESPTPTTTTPSPTSPADGFTLTTKVSGKGTITRDPNQTRYEAGTTVSLTATGSGKYKFVRWSGAASGSANPIQVTMDKNQTVTAVFKGPGSSSGGSGGGGAAYVPPPTEITLGLTGLNSTASLVTNMLGVVQKAIQLKTPDGKVTLDIPAGAALKDSNGSALKSISASIPPTPPAPPQDNAIILDWALGPDGAVFNPPLDLTLQYDPGAIPARGAEDTLYLAYWDGSKWVTQESQRDAVKKTITAKITHFSQYAILDKIPPPPKFEISGLRISRINIQPGQPVEITIMAYNNGGSSGEYDIILKLNGVEAEKKTITLTAGANKEVTFEVNKTVPGTYIFEVNGLPGRFQVVEATPSTAAAAISPSVTAALPDTGKVAELTSPAIDSPAPATEIAAVSSPEKETIPVQQSYSLPVKWIVVGLAAVMILIAVIFMTSIRRRT